MSDRAGVRGLSGLTTRGRCLLAGGLATAACSVVLAERDLLRVGAFVAILPLLALLAAARTRRRIGAERRLSPCRVPVDGDVTATITLRGPVLLGALRLADIVPDAAGPSPAAPPRFTVHRLSSRGGARLTYPLHPRLRGAHAIGPLATTVGDPLGLAEFVRSLGGTDQLLVLPRVVPLEGAPAPMAGGEGTGGAAAAHQGHGDPDVGVREYRYGDELRRVHWRSTARHDEITVRLEERPWRGGTTILLDRRDAAHRGRGPDASLEFAVSMAASIAAHLVGRGMPVGIVTEDGAPVCAGSGLDPMLDALAALRPSARTDLAGSALGTGSDLIAVLGAVEGSRVESLLARRPTPGHAVLLDTATWDPSQARPGSADAAATALRRAGWSVAIAQAGTTPDRVWTNLVVARASAQAVVAAGGRM
jgi:uncharacterized protein (DUF58 family)